MFLKSHDKVLECSPARQNTREISDSELFYVYIEPLKVGRGRPKDGNIWRVRYTDGYVRHAKHFPSEVRARRAFDEAVMFNGFLDEDE